MLRARSAAAQKTVLIVIVVPLFLLFLLFLLSFLSFLLFLLFLLFFLHSLRAGIVSPFHLFRDYQCLIWCVGLFVFAGSGFCSLCCFFVCCLNSEMHNYVILSMTVTIVTMSAAMEQKNLVVLVVLVVFFVLVVLLVLLVLLVFFLLFSLF